VGYSYVAHGSGGALAAARVGERVRNPNRQPPWLIVDHALSNVMVTSWPGRLLRVEVVDAATERDGAGGLVADAGYTRAVEVAIVDELPAWQLFGEHGQALARVIDAALLLMGDGFAVDASYTRLLRSAPMNVFRLSACLEVLLALCFDTRRLDGAGLEATTYGFSLGLGWASGLSYH
jgi:hypothetical protein